jgi:hypothetical protein
MLYPWFSAMLLTLEVTETFTLFALKMGWGITGMLSGHPLSPHQNPFRSPGHRPLTEPEVARILLERTGGTWPAHHSEA